MRARTSRPRKFDLERECWIELEVVTDWRHDGRFYRVRLFDPKSAKYNKENKRESASWDFWTEDAAMARIRRYQRLGIPPKTLEYNDDYVLKYGRHGFEIARVSPCGSSYGILWLGTERAAREEFRRLSHSSKKTTKIESRSPNKGRTQNDNSRVYLA